MAESSKDILNRILGNVNPEYDTTDGSFFYDLNAPISIELSSAYELIADVLRRRNVATSTGDDLTGLCAEDGVDRHLATYSTGNVIVKGVVGAPINQGDLVASDLITFEFMENKIIPESGQIIVMVQSKIIGSGGNVPIGAIKSFPKTLQGLQSVTNPEPTSDGYDQETDESLRERYYIKVRTPATSGNKWHYLQWAREVTGVGQAKVIPVWAGKGTVKVIITDSNKRGASQTLINATYDHIEEVKPLCGGTLTVVSATEKPINITTNVKLSPGTNLGSIQATITKLIDDYLKSVVFNTTYISIAKIGDLILDSGTLDYTGLTLNGSNTNISINNDEIAVIGSISLGVI